MHPIYCYLKIHQPYQLRPYDFSMIGQEHGYEHEEQHQLVMSQLEKAMYLPTNRFLQKLLKKHQGNLRLALLFSGCTLELLSLYSPLSLASFQGLIQSPYVALLRTTYYHSLSGLYSPQEHEQQLKKHQAIVQKLFGKPTYGLDELSPTRYVLSQDYHRLVPDTFATAVEHSLGQGYVTAPHVFAEHKDYLSNKLQKEAVAKLYGLEERVRQSVNEQLIETWRRLQVADYFSYMSMQGQSQPIPFSSPFDAYINYMNILSDFEGRIGKALHSQQNQG